MKLRRMSGCGCVRIGLAAAMLAMAVPPTALAVAEKPKPGALWEAFPLEPTPERTSTPVTPTRELPASLFLPPSEGRPEATTVTDPPSPASGPGFIVVAFAAALLLLVATVGVLSGRRLNVGKRHRRTTVPLWQRGTLPLTSDYDRQRHGSDIRTSSARVGHERRAVEPDFLGPLYQWVEVDKPPVGRSHRSLGSEVSTLIHRLRRIVWTEETIPVIIGSVLAVVLGLLLVNLIG